MYTDTPNSSTSGRYTDQETRPPSASGSDPECHAIGRVRASYCFSEASFTNPTAEATDA